MRRLFTYAALCAAFLLLTGSAAATVRHQAGDGHHEGSAASTRAATGDAVAGKAHFAPLGARLSGAATVYGALYDSNGSPSAGASVEWWSEESDGWYTGSVTTAADGAFSMTARPTSNGEIWAYPNDASVFARGGETWLDGNSYGRTLYPGRVYAGATLGGGWEDDFEYLAVRLWGAGRFSRGEVPANGTSNPAANIDVLDGNYTVGSAKFFWDEGLEIHQSVGVTSGVTSGTAINVSETDAQRVWMKSPYWYSGKSGVSVRLALDNYPAGWINRVTGYTDDPDETVSQTYGTWTSATAAPQTLRVKVPSAAKPGYAYWVGFQHVDAAGSDYPLYLEEMYQVCTMKASKKSVKRGAKIRVTGIIPTEGHWGSEAGLKKVVTLYAHKGKAAVPTKWNPKKQGWVKVGSVRADGYGVYKTPFFKPLKTLTLVARYPGDEWYFDAYTSTQKIRVR